MTKDQDADQHGEIVPPERRKFLARVGMALGALSAALVGVPVLGVILSPLRRRDDRVWRKIGSPDDFRRGGTVKVKFANPDPLPWAGPSAQSAAWLRRDADGSFSAFSVYCTHTACPVRWEQGAELFLCPCHGGAFYRDGSVAAGPPPRPLPQHPVRVRDGLVEIQTLPVHRT